MEYVIGYLTIGGLVSLGVSLVPAEHRPGSGALILILALWPLFVCIAGRALWIGVSHGLQQRENEVDP